MNTSFYITTSIPYVNAEPHVGFALELVQADALARYHRLLGQDVRFQTGTDENALKNVLAAEANRSSVQDWVDRHSQRFGALCRTLGCSEDDFIRTTEERHHRAVHRLWRSLKAGDVYRKGFTGLYCTGCEDFYVSEDLRNGVCPEHGTAPVEVTEENYFFRLSSYQDRLGELIAGNALRVIPETRKNEVLSFIERGLRDISISRSATRARGWGVSVPDDPSQVVYVWIDALTNYIAGLGFGDGGEAWRRHWHPHSTVTHVIGKNVWKFHAIYWPALLLSAGLPLPDEVLVHGFLTVNGRKIGKSLGNAVDPFGCIDIYGTDAVRYYLLRAIPPFDDGDFAADRLGQLYAADLADGLGNLLSRLTALCQRAEYGSHPWEGTPDAPPGYHAAIGEREFAKALAALWQVIGRINVDIQRQRPWEALKLGRLDAVHGCLREWLKVFGGVVYWLAPFLPDASQRALTALRCSPITAAPPLFPRLEAASGGVTGLRWP
jgi:methionyl-tRNA synthetase